MEIFKKLDENTLSITSEVKEPEVMEKTLDELESELKQAQDSLIYVQQRHADEIAPIQATIDLMQKRLDEAKKLNIVAKPVEVIEEV